MKPKTLRISGRMVVLLGAFWLGEFLLGRRYLRDSGFGLWTGAWTEHNSQRLADPYTLTDLLYGVIFYYLLVPAQGMISPGYRLPDCDPVGSSLGGIREYSLIIERYRSDTTAPNYCGDTILNSAFVSLRR